MEDTFVDASYTPTHSVREGGVSPLPRSRRQAFDRLDPERTPTIKPSNYKQGASIIEPLSIKKKTSLRGSGTSPSAGRKVGTRRSPAASTVAKIAHRRVSPQIKNVKIATSSRVKLDMDMDRMTELMEATKDDIETSRRAVKRIKIDIEQLRPAIARPAEQEDLQPRPFVRGLPRAPVVNNTPMTRAAQERMEEMRNLIGKRNGEIIPRARNRSRSFADVPGPPPSLEKARTGDLMKLIDEATSEADESLARAFSNQEALELDLQRLVADLQEKTMLYERARFELGASRRQCDLMKSLLVDATAEKEIMYDAFNEELDHMFTNAQLPEDEAWEAMVKDLSETKADRHMLEHQKALLERKLTEVEDEKEEWGALLRQHGLIS